MPNTKRSLLSALMQTFRKWSGGPKHTQRPTARAERRRRTRQRLKERSALCGVLLEQFPIVTAHNADLERCVQELAQRCLQLIDLCASQQKDIERLKNIAASPEAASNAVPQRSTLH